MYSICSQASMRACDSLAVAATALVRLMCSLSCCVYDKDVGFNLCRAQCQVLAGDNRRPEAV